MLQQWKHEAWRGKRAKTTTTGFIYFWQLFSNLVTADIFCVNTRSCSFLQTGVLPPGQVKHLNLGQDWRRKRGNQYEAVRQHLVSCDKRTGASYSGEFEMKSRKCSPARGRGDAPSNMVARFHLIAFVLNSSFNRRVFFFFPPNIETFFILQFQQKYHTIPVKLYSLLNT